MRGDPLANWVGTAFLFVLFFVLVTPVGLLLRLVGRDRLLDLRFEPTKSSYWSRSR